MKEEIKKVIKKYPNFFIYYHDNGSWVIYRSQKDVDIETGSEKHAPVLDGDDFMQDGYCPFLVEALAELLGGKTFSI